MLFSQEHYEEALKALKQAVTDWEESKVGEPELEDALTKMGLSQLKTGKYEDACDTFEKVLEKNPMAADIWYLSGLVMRGGLDQNEDAVEAFNRALELKPDLRAAQEQKGLALLSLCRYEEARDAFSSVLEESPENADVLYNRAVASFRTLNFEDAAKDLEKVLLFAPPDSPDYTEACYMLGIASIELQNYERALQALDMVLEWEPEHEEALYNMALVLFNLEEYEEAARTFEQLLETSPEDPESLNYLGLCSWNWTTSKKP